MGMNDERKSCVKCRKVVKSTEKALVCGLWCRKSFHNDCVGVTNTETRIVTCSNERIKFHCETCENRLCIELVGEKETHEPNKLQNSVNNCLLELVQKILNLTNELSNNNSVVNNKLDKVISSNTRLEEYILQSPKCVEKRSEETTANSIVCVETFSVTPAIEISEENDTNSDNTNLNSASKPQQTDDSSSLLQIESGAPKQLSDNQEALAAEEGSSNELEVPGHQNNLQGPLSTVSKECLQEWELRDDQSGTQDLPCTNSEECIPLEDFAIRNVFSIVKTEYEGGEENEEIEIDIEECSPSEDFLEGSTFSIEKIEHSVDGDVMREDILEELKHEVVPATSGNEPESTTLIGTEGNRDNDGRSFLFNVSHTSGKGHKFQCTTKQEMSCRINSATTCEEHKCKIGKKIFTNLQKVKENASMRRCEPRHSCEVCHKRFSCNSSLEEHLQMHTRKRQGVCDIYKTFICRSLKEHISLHTGERLYSCSVCNKTFRRKDSLQRHLLLHSGERPYSCSVCSKTFRHKTTLQDHLMLHSSERSFSCSVCSKKFRQKCVLKRHERLHSGDHPFRCSICSETFKSKTALKRHSRLHSRITSVTIGSKEQLGVSNCL